MFIGNVSVCQQSMHVLKVAGEREGGRERERERERGGREREGERERGEREREGEGERRVG